MSVNLKQRMGALTSAVRKVRDRKKKPEITLGEAAVRQYGVRGGLRVDEDVIKALTGGRPEAVQHFPQAIIETLETHDPEDYAAFAAAFKENIETIEAREIIERGLDK